MCSAFHFIQFASAFFFFQPRKDSSDKLYNNIKKELEQHRRHTQKKCITHAHDFFFVCVCVGVYVYVNLNFNRRVMVEAHQQLGEVPSLGYRSIGLLLCRPRMIDCSKKRMESEGRSKERKKKKKPFSCDK